jgi:hypothetical protein
VRWLRPNSRCRVHTLRKPTEGALCMCMLIADEHAHAHAEPTAGATCSWLAKHRSRGTSVARPPGKTALRHTQSMACTRHLVRQCSTAERCTLASTAKPSTVHDSASVTTEHAVQTRWDAVCTPARQQRKGHARGIKETHEQHKERNAHNAMQQQSRTSNSSREGSRGVRLARPEADSQRLMSYAPYRTSAFSRRSHRSVVKRSAQLLSENDPQWAEGCDVMTRQNLCHRHRTKKTLSIADRL